MYIGLLINKIAIALINVLTLAIALITCLLSGNQINLGPQAVTTDSDQYVRDIRDSYGAGFYLNEFVRVPGVRTTTEVIDWGMKSAYQAILSKPEIRWVNSLRMSEIND